MKQIRQRFQLLLLGLCIFRAPFIIKLFEDFIVETRNLFSPLPVSRVRICVHFNTYLLHFHHYHYGMLLFHSLSFPFSRLPSKFLNQLKCVCVLVRAKDAAISPPILRYKLSSENNTTFCTATI